jgi:osmotically-inducible protein OsmY
VDQLTHSGIRLIAATEEIILRPRVVMSADQEKLAARIERHIRRQTSDKVRELRVEVTDDRILIKGRCGTFYCKQLAQHAAMTLAGQESLVNQIDVW